MTSISLEKHLPRLFLAELARHPQAEPFSVPLEGAVMMTDISGFSALARRLTRDADHGAEDLREVLNDYFGALGALVARHGGDISTFAGDAVIAVWPGGHDPALAVLRAGRCALDIQAQAETWLPGREVRLTQRIAVAFGDLTVAKLGGLGGKWLNVLAGDTIVGAGRACDVAPAGQVLVTAEAAALVQDRATLTTAELGYLRLQAIRDALPEPPPQPSPAVDPALLAACVPQVLVRRARLGTAEWLAEFRRVSVMFVKLDHADIAPLGQLQDIACATQAVVQRYGGAMPYLQMDDKGLNFIIAFGIATAAYEDDAVRALRAALEIQRTLTGLGVRPAIGVGTGVLYCGECGAVDRRQYSLIGPAINFAARLAGAAPDDLLCDDETARAAGDALSFVVARNVRLKHEDAAALAFRPEWRDEAPAGRDGDLVGRRDELARLQSALDTSGPAAPRLLVRGEPGIGKSRLLRELVAESERRGVLVLAASARALEVDSPYFVWRELLRRLIGRLAQPGESAAQTLARQWRGAPLLEQWAALLNDVLPLELPGSALVEQMRGQARAASIQALLVHLLRQAMAAGPVLLMVDDQHWIDELSAALLETVLARLDELPAVMGSRPMEAGVHGGFVHGVGRLEIVDLEALDESQTAQMLARLYGVADVPVALSSKVHQRTEGNPFYIEQLALVLRETGQVEVVGGRCRLRDDVAHHVDQVLPDTLRGLIESRIDRLGEEAQLVLKVASVFGRAFSAEGLRAVYAAERPDADLSALLAGLQQVNLLMTDSDGERDLAFRHVLLQEAVYELLPLVQRRHLHRRIADWLEARYADALHGVFNVLASHCVRAEEYDRAIRHLEGGAATAIRHSAYLDAIAGIGSAQRLAAEHDLAPDVERQARWHALLGDAHHERSEYAEAKRHFHKVLELLGHPYAPSTAARGLDIARRLTTHLVGSLPQPAATAAAPDGPASMLSHAYQRLSEISYHDNAPVEVLHLNLLSMSHAQRAGAVAYLSAGHGGLAVALSQVGLAAAAARHSRHAVALAEAGGAAHDIAYAHLIAMVYASGRCDWPLLDDSAPRAEKLFGDLGDDFRRASVYALWTDCLLLRGDYDGAEARLALMARVLEDAAQPRVAGWYYDSRLQLGMARDQIAAADVERRAELARDLDSLVDRLMAFGNTAAAWLRLGERQRAVAAARQGLELFLGNVPVAGAGYIHGPLGVVEVLLAACTGRPDEALKQACDRLTAYTRQVPSTRPRGLFLLGQRAALEHKASRAERLWRQAVEAAEQLGMPYHRSVARLALAERHALPGESAQTVEQEFAALGVPAPALFRRQQGLEAAGG